MSAAGDNEESAGRLRSSNELNIIQLIRHELNNRDENSDKIAASLQNAQNMSAEQIQQVLQNQLNTPEGLFGLTQIPDNSQALFDTQVEDMEVEKLSQGLGSATISEKSQSTLGNYSPIPMNLLSDSFSPFPESGSPPPSVSPAPNGRILPQDVETQDILNLNTDDDQEINAIIEKYSKSGTNTNNDTPDASSQLPAMVTQEPWSFSQMQENQFSPVIGATPSDPHQQKRANKRKNESDSNGSVFSAVSIVRPTPKRRASRDSRTRRSSFATATSTNKLDDDFFAMPSLPPAPPSLPVPDFSHIENVLDDKALDDSVFKEPKPKSREISDITTFEMPSSFTDKFANQSAPLRTLQATESLSRERTLNEGRDLNHVFSSPSKISSIPKVSFTSSQLNMSQFSQNSNDSIKTFATVTSQELKSFSEKMKKSCSSRFQPYNSQRSFGSYASSSKSYIPKVQNWLSKNSNQTPTSSLQAERMPFNDTSNFESDLTVFDRIRSKESQKSQQLQKVKPQNRAEEILDELDEKYEAQKKKLPKKNFRYATSIQLLDPNNFR